MKKILVLVVIIMMAVACLSAQTANAYLTNMINGAPQDTVDVLTTGNDICPITFDVENSGTEPIILESVSFSCWNFNLSPDVIPNIQFYMVTNDGQWSATNNSIFDLNFQNIGSIIQPGTSKTFVVMGDIWSNSNGGSKFSLGLCGSGNFQVIGQNSGDTYLVNMVGPQQDNIFHIVNQWQPMHSLWSYPYHNPIEIYENYYQDELWVYPGQTFWSGYTLNSTFNSLQNSIVSLSAHTYFGNIVEQIIPGNFFVTEYLSGLVWDYHNNSFNMSWASPDVEGVDASFLYETLIQTNLWLNHSESEFTSANMGNYNPLFGMVNENASYERVYQPYQAIKLDINGDGTFTQADITMWHENNNGTVNLYGSNFHNNSEPNISRSCVLFYYPNNFDPWLGNVYLNHPEEDLVQGLGIGALYNGTWPNGLPATYSQNGNIITVDTEANCLGVFGRLPGGEEWNTIILMNGAENLRWSSERNSIEPERIQMDRTEIQIQIPQGLTNIDVQARGLAQYTSNDDPITPPAEIYPVLQQNFPNPFNPETKISYSLPKNGPVQIEVYNVKGQLIKTLENSQKATGDHNVNWNGTDTNGKPVPAGMYFYKMKVGKFSSTKKMVLLK